jgi:hypothetical protein
MRRSTLLWLGWLPYATLLVWVLAAAAEAWGSPAPSAAPIAAPTGSLPFEQAFSDVGEPAYAHFKASYLDARGSHVVEVWRIGNTRLRRRTDAALDIYAGQTAKQEVHFTILDHQRTIRTEVSRTNLFRIGRFVDWFGLAHGISKPLTDYRLAKLEKAPVAEAPSSPCQWYEITVEQHASAICWSSAYALPLLITNAAHEVQWRIASVETQRIPWDVFRIESPGYILVDANEDLGVE